MYKKAARSLSRSGAGLSWQANPVKLRKKTKPRIKTKTKGLKTKTSAPRALGADLYHLSKSKVRKSAPPFKPSAV